MGTIVRDVTYDGKVRRGCSFKDGPYIRYVEIHDGNLIRFTDTEGRTLYETRDLMGKGLIIQSVDDQTSSFGTPHMVLAFFGFTEGSDSSREIVLSTDYQVAPPLF